MEVPPEGTYKNYQEDDALQVLGHCLLCFLSIHIFGCIIERIYVCSGNRASKVPGLEVHHTVD